MKSGEVVGALIGSVFFSGVSLALAHHSTTTLNNQNPPNPNPTPPPPVPPGADLFVFTPSSTQQNPFKPGGIGYDATPSLAQAMSDQAIQWQINQILNDAAWKPLQDNLRKSGLFGNVTDLRKKVFAKAVSVAGNTFNTPYDKFDYFNDATFLWPMPHVEIQLEINRMLTSDDAGGWANWRAHTVHYDNKNQAMAGIWTEAQKYTVTKWPSSTTDNWGNYIYPNLDSVIHNKPFADTWFGGNWQNVVQWVVKIWNAVQTDGKQQNPASNPNVSADDISTMTDNSSYA